MFVLSATGISSYLPNLPKPAAFTNQRTSGKVSRTAEITSSVPPSVKSTAKMRTGVLSWFCNCCKFSFSNPIAQISCKPSPSRMRANSLPIPLDAPVTTAIFILYLLQNCFFDVPQQAKVQIFVAVCDFSTPLFCPMCNRATFLVFFCVKGYTPPTKANGETLCRTFPHRANPLGNAPCTFCTVF